MKWARFILCGVFMIVVPIFSAHAVGPGHAWASVEKICGSDKTLSGCLKHVMDFKCNSYAANLNEIWIEPACGDVGKKMIDLLDPAPLGEAGEGEEAVAFVTELQDLFGGQVAHSYLKHLVKALNFTIANKTPFNLFDFTLKEAGGNFDTALEWIAVLLQDIINAPEDFLTGFETPTYLTYVQTHVIHSCKAEKVLISAMELLGEGSTKNNPQIQVLPKPYSSFLNPNFYHFYVSAYLARKLWNAGAKNQEEATYTPFLFNTMYKFKNFTVSIWPLGTPAPFKKEAHAWDLRDMYAGYIAPYWALGKPNKALSIEKFSDMISRDPAGFLHRQLDAAFNGVTLLKSDGL